MTSSDKAYDFFKSQNKLAIALLGNGLAFAEGDDHKRQRKMMNPAFSHSNIKEMVPTFIRVTSTLKGLIKNEINQGNSNINLTPYISKTTLDIIGSVGFSYEFNSLTSSNELADSVFNAPLNTLRVAVILIANYIPFIKDILIGTNVEFKNACAVISRVSKKLVEEKYKEAENGELKNKDLLSLLINTNKILPDEEIMTYEELKNQAIKKIFIYLFTVRQISMKFPVFVGCYGNVVQIRQVSIIYTKIMTFLVTGHETTSATTCWALYLLAQHPHEQDLLREELVKVIPDKSNFNLSYDEINSLEYLNCVIKETLRMCTPVSIISRTNLKDEVFGKYFIPKNSEIFIGISAFQKSSEIWGPTADNFDPKRWLNPSLNVTNLNYSPFLGGPRGCIGNKLALAEMKIMLGMLIRNFVFQPIEGFQTRKKPFPLSKPDPYIGLAISIVES
ncbi:cytochrome P450 [Rhizophagus irregularis]|uniref:Cytochrome P450 n=1 Tax=Rhizophagus irregularis TaxID=588596 RepID=A0A2N0Q349_9GLOM|nr:cytochrome P450 [Rhizophagus irregularis]